ncbi:MAG: hypothetical protein JWM32_1557 [Verrucomicrobia bacterium]|nr:hypothetical protein [Verrucomicrobiota bacterium]
MKFVFLAGGLAGFLLAGAAGLWAGRAIDRVLFDASVGCLVGALLFRWFWTVLVRGIRETILLRHAAANPAGKTK